MQNAKCQDHRHYVSGEDFLKVFTVNGCGGCLDHVAWGRGVSAPALGLYFFYTCLTIFIHLLL